MSIVQHSCSFKRKKILYAHQYLQKLYLISIHLYMGCTLQLAIGIYHIDNVIVVTMMFLPVKELSVTSSRSINWYIMF